MKRLVFGCWLSVVGCCCFARADETPVRNPFWPQGYEGTRYPITLEPRFKQEPVKEVDPVVQSNAVIQAQQAAAAAKLAEEKRKDPLENPIWNDAVKTLRFGSTMSFSANGRTQAAITINDRSYVAGDLISANFEDCRFTWRIESLSTDGKIKLKRITYRKIGTNP